MFLIISLLALAAGVAAYDYTRHNRSLVLHRRPLMCNYTRPSLTSNYTRPLLVSNNSRAQPVVTVMNTTTPLPAPAPRSLRRS